MSWLPVARPELQPIPGIFAAYGRYTATRLGQAEVIYTGEGWNATVAVTRLPGGVPVFPGIPPATPEDLLAQHGLKPGAMRDLDASAGLALTVWRR